MSNKEPVDVAVQGYFDVRDRVATLLSRDTLEVDKLADLNVKLATWASYVGQHVSEMEVDYANEYQKLYQDDASRTPSASKTYAEAGLVVKKANIKKLTGLRSDARMLHKSIESELMHLASVRKRGI